MKVEDVIVKDPYIAYIAPPCQLALFLLKLELSTATVEIREVIAGPNVAFNSLKLEDLTAASDTLYK